MGILAPDTLSSIFYPLIFCSPSHNLPFGLVDRDERHSLDLVAILCDPPANNSLYPRIAEVNLKIHMAE
ncbi:hypothetical protein BN1723_001300, partial [Verticillium longisporum]